MKLATVQTVEEFTTEVDLLEQITKLDAAIKETIKEQVPINNPAHMQRDGGLKTEETQGEASKVII